MNEMHSIPERDAFSYGFRLGVQLMGLSQMQISEHLRQLFLYDLSKKEAEKEKSLKMR